jgi:hypothetical protein
LTTSANALTDRYRCPEGYAEFSLAGDLRSEQGFFSFGHDAVCYGRTVRGVLARHAGDPLTNMYPHAALKGPPVRLPFELDEIVDNLRCERYMTLRNGGAPSLLSSQAVRRMYYHLRPFFGVAFRKHLQRFFHRDWDALTFPAWPVDRTVENLMESMLVLSMQGQELQEIPFIWFWPDGASSCAVMTHDVETQAGVDFVPRLMDLDEHFGIKTSFQVIPQKQYPVSEAFLSSIRDRGFEINVQDLEHDGNLFGEREKFLTHAQLINGYLREWGSQGFRSGRLYRNLDWYKELDMSYDMSVPNVAHLDPQRGGCCTVFPYFIGDILELPLTTTQDYTLLHILGECSTELWKRQVSLIREKHGVASFIVHPDYILERREQEVYKALLSYLSALREEVNVWIAAPGEVNRWWRERSKMKLVPEGAGWRIEGPGRERARLAYARVADGRCAYTLEEKS